MSHGNKLGYSKTPTPLPDAPRRVRGKAGLGVGCSRVLLLPHVVVGLSVLLMLALQVLWLFFAAEYPGVVTGVKETQRKGVTNYHVTYRFNAGGQEMTDRAKVELGDFERFKGLLGGPEEARSVKVRYFALAGPLSQARLPAYESPWGLIGFLVVFALFWNGIMWVFLHSIWIKPMLTRRLYVTGDATTGRVVSKQTVRGGKSSTYRVSYTFKDPVTGEEVAGSVDTNWERFAAVQEGDEVTVLYRANKPSRNVPYELGGYEVKDV
jgi:hypothetical protein